MIDPAKCQKEKYKIAVRVVDILGNDTLQIVEVKI